jgi:nucleotide-binding universal stress UspA family protein
VSDATPISKLLVAADGSDASWAAVRFGADLAAFAQADLAIVHVLLQGPVPRGIAEEAGLDTNSGRYTRGGDAVGSTWFFPQPMSENDLEAIGRKLLDRAQALAEERGATKVSTDLKHGMISETLLSVLHDKQPCLAVLGRSGLGQSVPTRQRRRRRIGGVSRRVMAEARCPTTLLSA